MTRSETTPARQGEKNPENGWGREDALTMISHYCQKAITYLSWMTLIATGMDKTLLYLRMSIDKCGRLLYKYTYLVGTKKSLDALCARYHEGPVAGNCCPMAGPFFR